MSKHTPRPWRVERNRNGHRGQVEVVGPSLSVIGFTVATDVTPEGARRRLADANLIAAAPALLDALENLVLACECAGTNWRTGAPFGFDQLEATANEARAAIAAANGDAP